MENRGGTPPPRIPRSTSPPGHSVVSRPSIFADTFPAFRPCLLQLPFFQFSVSDFHIQFYNLVSSRGLLCFQYGSYRGEDGSRTAAILKTEKTLGTRLSTLILYEGREDRAELSTAHVRYVTRE